MVFANGFMMTDNLVQKSRLGVGMWVVLLASLGCQRMPMKLI